MYTLWIFCGENAVPKDRPGQRLSVEELCGPPEEAQSGWHQEPRACGAGQKTNIDTSPAWRA